MALIYKKQFKNFVLHQGVTLVELIVVIGIFSVVSAILIFNYSDFSTNVSVRNLSQEIALSIRKAQTYATSVRGIDKVKSSTKDYPAYGVSFSLDTTSNPFFPNNKSFILFADIPGYPVASPNNRHYDNDGNCGNLQPGSECIENFTIETFDSIVEICTDATGCVNAGSFDITFQRPTPDAMICYKAPGTDSCQSTSISYINIVLQSAKGLRRAVSVWNTGQISVK